MTHAPTVAADASGLTRAAATLRAGGLVALPTETFYGVAAAVDQPAALQRLCALKDRPSNAPFPVLVSGWEGAAGAHRLLSPELPEPQAARARSLTERFWPGPLTLVLPAGGSVPACLVGPGGGVGVRRSPAPFVEQLLGELGCPVTATSANLRGQPPPCSAEEVLEGLGAHVDLVIGGPRLRGGLPSTVLQIEGEGSLELLRPGRLPLRLLEAPDEHSLDSLRRGTVPFVQPRGRGLRVSVDPVLLALFLHDRVTGGPVVDLGTGVGIIPLLLASDGASGPFWGVELQPELVRLAGENALLNGFASGRLQLVAADLRHLEGTLPEGCAAWVVSNPPYNLPRRGRPSPESARSLACHELTCSLRELVTAAARLLRPDGTLALVQRGDREEETLEELGQAGLVATRLRRVRGRPGRPYRHFLVEARHAAVAGPYRQEPTLVLRGVRGPAYCAELAEWLEGRPPGPREAC